MDGTLEHKQDQAGSIPPSWGQYASGEGLARFAYWLPCDANQKPLGDITNVKQGRTSKDLVEAPKTKHTEPQGSPTFGIPSPKRDSPWGPDWVSIEAQVPEAEPHRHLSLYDLYEQFPDKKLQSSFEPGTLNLAEKVVLHVINKAGHCWFKQWVPGLNLVDFFGGDDKRSKAATKQHVPAEAIETRWMTTSLADLYRRCHNVHPRGSGDIQYPQLLRLIDQGVHFLRVLKVHELKTLLQKTKSLLQWIPVGLDAKKLGIHKQARVELDKLNLLCEDATMNSTIPKRVALKHKHQDWQLKILDKALADFEIHRKSFEVNILDWLKMMLRSTDKTVIEHVKTEGQ
ncbi:hypothetical protein F4808DRAFT_123024 [Astrocystis sublimbata]|nr:hypothetical protein F4808DRAFT_123024 [Astrocystis sublimbata]